MTSIHWKNAVTWSPLGLMFLLLALVFGPAPALAANESDADAVLYEVTEDMYLKDAAGNAVRCALNATGADDLSLVTGTGTLSGTFAVVVQGDNLVDGPEFVIMTGTFKGDADLSQSLAGVAPLGRIRNGVAAIDANGDGQPDLTFNFSGRFRLPFALDEAGRNGKPRLDRDAFYLNDQGGLIKVRDNERSLGVPTVRLEITF